MILFILLGIVGWLYGDPKQWLNPVTSDGVICTGDTPNLLMFDITKCLQLSASLASLSAASNLQCPTTSICVATCPTDFLVNIPVGAPSPASQVKCRSGVTWGSDDQTRLDQLKNEDCIAYELPSAAVLNRCLPSIPVNELSTIMNSGALDTAFEVAGDQLVTYASDGTTTALTPNLVIDAMEFFNNNILGSQEFFSKAVQDLVDSWQWIVAGLCIAILLSLILMTIIRCIVGPIIYVLMVLILAGLGVGIWFTYTKWQELLLVDSATVASSSLLETANTWKVAFIVCCVLIAVFLLIFIIVAGRLGIAIAVIGEASNAIWSMLSSLLFPIVTSVWVVLIRNY